MAEVNFQITVKTRIDADPNPHTSHPSLHPRIKRKGLFWRTLSFLCSCGDGAEGQTEERFWAECDPWPCITWHRLHAASSVRTQPATEKGQMFVTVGANDKNHTAKKTKKKKRGLILHHHLLPHMQTCQKAQWHTQLVRRRVGVWKGASVFSPSPWL